MDKILLTAWLVLQTVYCVYALQCLRCDRVISPIHCHGKTTCDSHEICYLEQFTGLDGEILYNVGCKARELCKNQVSTKRASMKGEVQLCNQCCDGNLCNVAGCGAKGYPYYRGPICYNCPQSRNPQKCDQIKVCGQDDMCHIQMQEEFGEYFYTTRCLSKHLCNMNGANIFGKRRKRGASKRNTKCSACCHGDLCNSNCYHNEVTGYTRPYIGTSPYNPYYHHSTRPWRHSTDNWYYMSTAPYHHHSTKPWQHHSTKPWQHHSTKPWQHYSTDMYATTTGVPIKDHKGTSFMVLFTPNTQPTFSFKNLELLITSEYTHFSVLVRTPKNGFNVTRSTQNRIIKISLQSDLENVPYVTDKYNLIYNTGVMVTSNRPISVVGLSEYGENAGDAFSAIPVSYLGTQYILSSFPSGTESYGAVAFYENTIIRADMLHTNRSKVKINPMESSMLTTKTDITGSRVESDKPIALLSGNENFQLNGSRNYFGTEMLIPIDKYQELFIVPRIAKVKNVILRIVPDDDFTTVYVTGKNGYYKNTYKQYVNQLDLPNDGFFINAQRRVMVTMYTHDEGAGRRPFMTLLPAINQFSNNYVITTPTNHYENYATIIINSKDLEQGLRINGGSALFHSVDIAPINKFNEVYKSISVRLDFNDTAYVITHTDPSVKFGLIVYGFRNGSSYGYPGGFLF